MILCENFNQSHSLDHHDECDWLKKQLQAQHTLITQALTLKPFTNQNVSDHFSALFSLHHAIEDYI